MVNPIIIAQSYDSPQLFGLLLFPLIAYSFLKKKYLLGGGLLAITLLFNYFITITIGAVLLIFAAIKMIKGDKSSLIHAGLIVLIGVGIVSPWLLVTMSKSGECFDPSTAVSSITGAGIEYLLMMAPFVIFFGVLILYPLRNKNDDYTLFWKVAYTLGVVGFLVSLAIPQLHPYDQLLLLGFSAVFLFPELKWKKEYMIILTVLAIITSVGIVGTMAPALSEDDLNAVYWVKDNVESGNILANPEISGTINTLTMNEEIRTEFDLFLECIPDSTRWSEMYTVLQTSDKEQAMATLEKYETDYVIVGARDVWNYGFDIDKFKEMGLEAIYISGESIVYKK